MKVRAVFQARFVDRPVVVFTAAEASVSDKPQVCGDGGSVLYKNLLCADCAVNFDLLSLVIELPRLYDIGSRCRPRLNKKRIAPHRGVTNVIQHMAQFSLADMLVVAGFCKTCAKDKGRLFSFCPFCGERFALSRR